MSSSVVGFIKDLRATKAKCALLLHLSLSLGSAECATASGVGFLVSYWFWSGLEWFGVVPVQEGKRMLPNKKVTVTFRQERGPRLRLLSSQRGWLQRPVCLLQAAQKIA